MKLILRSLLAFGALALLLAGCLTATAPAATPTPAVTATTTPLPPTPTALASGRTVLVITTAAGRQVEVTAELAVNPAQRAQGLMFRAQLPAGQGMLFVFPEDTTAAFWMKNTQVPLSIAFIAADGGIVGTDDMAPLDETLHNSPRAYRYALEVSQGFFAQQGVKPGDRVRYREGGQILPLAQLPATRQAS